MFLFVPDIDSVLACVAVVQRGGKGGRGEFKFEREVRREREPQSLDSSQVPKIALRPSDPPLRGRI